MLSLWEARMERMPQHVPNTLVKKRTHDRDLNNTSGTTEKYAGRDQKPNVSDAPNV